MHKQKGKVTNTDHCPQLLSRRAMTRDEDTKKKEWNFDMTHVCGKDKVKKEVKEVPKSVIKSKVMQLQRADNETRKQKWKPLRNSRLRQKLAITEGSTVSRLRQFNYRCSLSIINDGSVKETNNNLYPFKSKEASIYYLCNPQYTVTGHCHQKKA